MLAIGLLFVAPLTSSTVLLAALIVSLYWDELLFVPVFPGHGLVGPRFYWVTPRLLGLLVAAELGVRALVAANLYLLSIEAPRPR